MFQEDLGKLRKTHTQYLIKWLDLYRLAATQTQLKGKGKHDKSTKKKRDTVKEKRIEGTDIVHYYLKAHEE